MFTVNAIAPGLIETDMSRPFIAMAAPKLRERIPMRREGQVIAVDGGIG